MRYFSGFTTIYTMEEIEELSKDEYISILQAPDVKSAVMKVLNRKIGEYVYSVLEQRKLLAIDELIKHIDAYYAVKLSRLCLYNNKYTSIAEEILDIVDLCVLLHCIRVSRTACVPFLGSGLYRYWLLYGEQGVRRYVETRGALNRIYTMSMESGKVDTNELFFHMKNVWERIVFHSSYPARKALGLLHDVVAARLLIASGSRDLSRLTTAYVSKQDLAVMVNSLMEGRLDGLRALDSYLPEFSNVYSELVKFSPKFLSLDLAFLLSMEPYISDLKLDMHENNLRRYLLLLREAFLLKAVFLSVSSQTNKSELAGIISRRLMR